MQLKTVPFSTIAPGEPMMRVGLGSLALAHLCGDEKPAHLRNLYMTLDTPEVVNQRLTGVFDMNFPPVAVVNLYERVTTLAESQKDLALRQTDLYIDTLVFNLRNRLPAEAVWEHHFAVGIHKRIDTFLIFNQGGKAHFFKCGGPNPGDDVDKFFLDWGKVGTASLPDIKDQYEFARIKTALDWDEEGTRNTDYINWMVGNALIANLAFTAVSQQ